MKECFIWLRSILVAIFEGHCRGPIYYGFRDFTRRPPNGNYPNFCLKHGSEPYVKMGYQEIGDPLLPNARYVITARFKLKHHNVA